MSQDAMMRGIGNYKVMRLLGRGGMSEVYEVENVRLGSRHALKIFTYEKDDAEVRERFLVEGRLLARLNHPRIVRVTDFGADEASGRPYFVMDLVLNGHGEMQLQAHIEPGTADEERIGGWYDDLREGLAYIHSNGVIHRDLKLQNVLIGPDGHAVLTDFGISKIFDPKGDGVQIVDTVRTLVKLREGRSLVMGSLGYMAPELEMGVAASPQSDWYALGVIVYRLLTGTWCDSRTDFSETLETYDPVWKRILPKLLHSNPNGRECLSYAKEKRRDRERLDLESENRLLSEQKGNHRMRVLSFGLLLATLFSAAAGAYMHVRHVAERRLWKTESRLSRLNASPYDFDEIFRIPQSAKAEAQTDERGEILMPSRKDLAASQIDLLVITHGLFADLVAGKVTIEKAIVELERLQDGFATEPENPFDKWPAGYLPVGNNETIHWFLAHALERLRGLSES